MNSRLFNSLLLMAFCVQTANASPGLCDLTIHDSESGQIKGPADSVFKPGEQFVLCFNVNEDGFVSLWDRIPVTGPIERLTPNKIGEHRDRKALPVTTERSNCFGTGVEGYYLFIDPDDGVGPGLMWLVFQKDEAMHPEEGSFDTASLFDGAYKRYGAGALSVSKPSDSGRKTDPSSERVWCDDGVRTLVFRYSVQEAN